MHGIIIVISNDCLKGKKKKEDKSFSVFLSNDYDFKRF